MDKQIIQLLKSDDPRKRRRGMEQLVISNDPDTLRVLHALYKKDKDADIRALAAKNIKEIRAREAQAEALAAEKPKQDKRISPEKAQKHLSRAMNYLIEGDFWEAKESARAAFQADPSLQHDDYALGLAAELTGVDNSLAYEALMGEEGAGKRKRKRKPSGAEQTSWTQALIVSAIYGLLTAIPGFIVLFGAESFSNLLLAFDQTGELAQAGINAQMLKNASVGFSVSLIIGLFIGGILFYMLYHAVVHFASTTILGGSGYYTTLLKKVFPPYAVNAVFNVVLIGVIFFVISSIFSDPALVEQLNAVDGEAVLPASVMQQLNVLQVINIVQFVFSIIIFIWLIKRIGATYDFGSLKGCFSLLITAVLLFVFFCGLGFLLSFITGSLVASVNF